MKKKSDGVRLFVFVLFASLCSLQLVGAYYIADFAFTVPQGVYTTGERIELRGHLLLKNYTANGSLVSNYTAVSGGTINITISNATANLTNYTLVTNTFGYFSSRSDYNTSAPLINAPNTTNTYRIRAEYTDVNNTLWYSSVEIRVVNQSIDYIRVSPAKTTYNPSETILIHAEAVRLVGDRVVFVSNVSINGSIQNVTNKTALSTFNCTTSDNGKCTTSVTGPSAYGNYFLEANNYKAYSRFSVVPFTVNAYMKDSTGKSYKSTYARGEEASVEVGVVTNVTDETYTFSGYIADSKGNVIKTVDSTTLNTNNSYTNKFAFTLDTANFSLGTYYAQLTISKSGDGSIDVLTSFEVKDWTFSVVKRSALSGFEYDYSAFQNVTLYFDIYPKWRGNGSVVSDINTTSSLVVNITDKLNNNLANASVTWNASCGNGGCYQFSLTSPSVLGSYYVTALLSHQGSTQKSRAPVYVIDMVIAAQATNEEGAIKELFGTNELVYLSLTSYNSTATSINLSTAEILFINYMNGTEQNYTNVSYGTVNGTNTPLEWAWNTTSQRFQLDAPKTGGVYGAVIVANNKTVSTTGRFMVNPYDICAVAKNTAGSVTASSGSSSYYYVWQFKTTDTVYFELKTIQASNPLGKATASNFTTGGNGSATANYGMGAACSVNTQTQQVVNNASVVVEKVVNTQNGIEYGVNTTASVCTAIDNEGGYTCTVAPATKWDGGTYSVRMKVTGADGSSDIAYGLFEARAFYLYGYSNTWQNGPTNNITLTTRMYEAGNNWWGSYGSGGMAGTVKVEKVEYMGKDGDWIWPPVDSGYNVSALNTSSITTGSGTLSVPVSNTKKGTWDSGNYRIILKGTDSSGNVDYGYAWFAVKLWDVYSTPVQCSSNSTCSYKSYFSSRENVTLYVKINNAGSWSYNDAGGQNLGGNVTIKVRKIDDCRSWPCKELNASLYTATSIIVNASSPWYWHSSVNTSSAYLISINKSDSRWGTGWFNVILDVNGTDTGYGWYNTIAFYANAQPTASTGSGWKYSIKPRESMYFNTTTTKGYVGWNYAYSAGDYVNTTVNDSMLRVWDQSTYQAKEFNYPEDFNISVVNRTDLQIVGNGLVNVTHRTTNWPSGWYWGDLTLINGDNETSNAWIWFNALPFRVDVTVSTYEVDSADCVNATIFVREPDWSNSSILTGNYTIQSVYERLWTGSSNTLVTYTNFSNTSFSGTRNATFCPNNADWGSGSWGGYHYLNIVVNDTANNVTQTGWLSFRGTQFRSTWGSVVGGTSKRTTDPVNVTASITKPNGAIARGNITRIYQWRYDSTTNYAGTLETYNFTVTNGTTCTSSSAGSGGCQINGSATISVTAPSRGWKVGSNYLQADWISTSGGQVQDYNSVYFTGLEAYNGWFSSTDSNGNWISGYAADANVTLTMKVRDSNYNDASSITVNNIQYGLYSNGCWSEWCASYTTASWSFVSGGSGTTLTNGSAVVKLTTPSGGWAKGTYTVKSSVTGSAGTSTISSSTFSIRDFTGPNITINAPAVVNLTYNVTNVTIFNFTTSESAICYVRTEDYGNFYSWRGCSAISAANGSSTGLVNSCNKTFYGFKNGTKYLTEHAAKDWYSWYNGSQSRYTSAASNFTTGDTRHLYTMNFTDFVAQDYGAQIVCYDADYNYGYAYTAFHMNKTT